MMDSAQEIQSENINLMQQPGGLSVFSEELQNISDNLDLLYIRSNASGRNKFRDKWPKVAEYIFGEQLITYDNEGTQDHDLRIQLEADAGERRISLKQTIAELKEKSIDEGSLQADYVGNVIDLYGPYIASLLYLDNIVDRVRAGSLEKIEAAREEIEQMKQDTASGKQKAAQPPASNKIQEQALNEQPNSNSELQEEQQTLPAKEAVSASLKEVEPIATPLPAEPEQVVIEEPTLEHSSELLDPELKAAPEVSDTPIEEPILNQSSELLDQEINNPPVAADLEPVNQELLTEDNAINEEAAIQEQVVVEGLEAENKAPILNEALSGKHLNNDPEEKQKLNVAVEEEPVLSSPAEIEPIPSPQAAMEPIITEDTAPLEQSPESQPEPEANNSPIMDHIQGDAAVSPEAESKSASLFSKKEESATSLFDKKPAADTPAAPSIFSKKTEAPPAQDTLAVEEPPKKIQSGIYTILFNTASGHSA